MADGDVQIKVNAAESAPTDAITVDPTGIQVELLIPPHVTLQSAVLTLQAPDDTHTLELTPAFATDLGQGGLSPTNPIQWFTADWQTRRPLTSVKITTATSATSTDEGSTEGASTEAASTEGASTEGASTDTAPELQGRVQLADGASPWFPPLPVQFVALDAEQSLPGLMASRMMVQIETIPEEPEPGVTPPLGSIVVSAVELKAAARPSDLTIAVQQESPFYNQTTLLAPNQELTLRDELLRALQSAWPPNESGGSLSLFIRSASTAQIYWKKLALTTCKAIVEFEPSQTEVTLSVERDVQSSVRIPLPANCSVRSIDLQLTPALRSEAPSREPLLPAASSTTSHIVGSDHVAAQAFAVPAGGAQLDGVDLFLRVISERNPGGTGKAKGTLTIHPDQSGRPADMPVEGASVLVELSADEISSRWFPFLLPKPAALKQGIFWIVFRLDEGNVLWHLGKLERNNAPLPRPETLHCWAKGPWIELDSDGANSSELDFAWARPRFHADAPPPVSKIQVWICVGADGERVPVTPDATGRISIKDERLKTPSGETPFYTVVIKAPVAGKITLSKLRVELDPVDSTMEA